MTKKYSNFYSLNIYSGIIIYFFLLKVYLINLKMSAEILSGRSGYGLLKKF